MAEAITYNFAGKKALVTGGSRGIGRHIVETLAASNIDKIYVIGRDKKALDDVKSSVPRVETICLDLSNWQMVKDVLAEVEAVDFLINNAGTNVPQPFDEITEEAFDTIVGVNVKSLVSVSQVVCKKMREDLGGGVVVNMSSQASMKALPGHLCYGASKAAVDSITRQMAFELAPEIRVNCVNPTVVLTELGRGTWDNPVGDEMKAKIPLKRFAELEDVTGAVMFLLSGGAGMVNGHALPICGGFTNI